MNKDNNRIDLLLHMYDQMFNDINRHIMVVWQSVGVLVAAFAFLALTEKKVISMDLAVSLVLLIVGWLLAHLHDSAYWYNRNLVIIANIERQFLEKDDLKDIHYYFGAHRPKNKMIQHLRIQFALGVGIGAIILIYHFIIRVVPGFGNTWSNLQPERCLPYAMVVIAIIYIFHVRRMCREKYGEFLKNSPGKQIDAEGIKYGVGHGFDTGGNNK